MKLNRLFPLSLLVTLAFLLTACGGQLAATSWPGLSSPDGVVYVAYTGQVYAINAENGAEIWNYPEKADRRMFFAAPIQTGDQVIAGDYNNALISLDAQNGAEKWTFEGAKGRWIGSPLVIGETILAPNADHYLYALDLNGNLLWKFETGQAIWSTPLSDEEKAYVASMDHYLYAVDLGTGEQQWKLDLGGALVYSPELGENGELYVATLGNELLAVDTANGEVIWRELIDHPLWSKPTLHEGVLYLGDQNGSVYAYDAESGAPQWTLDLGSSEDPVVVTGAPTVFSEGLIFSTEEDGIFAVSFDGRKLWDKPVNGKLYNGPVTSGDLLVVGVTGGDNLLVAFNQIGNQVWTFAPPE